MKQKKVDHFGFSWSWSRGCLQVTCFMTRFSAFDRCTSFPSLFFSWLVLFFSFLPSFSLSLFFFFPNVFRDLWTSWSSPSDPWWHFNWFWLVSRHSNSYCHWPRQGFLFSFFFFLSFLFHFFFERTELSLSYPLFFSCCRFMADSSWMGEWKKPSV